MFLIDLHNDLLSYMAADVLKHSPLDTETRSSADQYISSDCRAAVFVAFTAVHAPSYHLQLERQAAILKTLPDKYSHIYLPLFSSRCIPGKIAPFFAIENCSSFSHEDEPLDASFNRFIEVAQELQGYPLYASLTWNGVNRFGAGSFSTAQEEECGLTADGRALVDFLFDKVEAFDVSHASDRLAFQLFDYLEKKGYPTKVIASHSNFRAVWNSPRNIPDEIALEIKRRGGLIGINCIRPFLGDDFSSFQRHIEYGISLVGEESLALGADFFSLESLPENQKARFKDYFFEEIASADLLQPIFDGIARSLGFDAIEKMASKNALEKLIHPALERKCI